MLSQQTLVKMRSMKLKGMADAFERQLSQPATYDIGFEERIGMLVDCEKTSRDNGRLTRLLKNAKLKHPACLEDIIYNARRGLDKGQIANLAICDWISARQQLLITGATGVGKTWLACALGNQAARQGLSVLYTRMPRLFEDLKVAHGDGSFGKKMLQMAKVDLLILDDWGLKALATQERHDMLEIIEERNNSRSTLVTSQLPIDHWHEYIGNPTLADAILDRLLENAHRINLNGESLRKTK